MRETGGTNIDFAQRTKRMGSINHAGVEENETESIHRYMADEKYDGTHLTSEALKATRSTTKLEEFLKASKQTEQQSSRDISSFDPIYDVTHLQHRPIHPSCL